MSHPEKPKSSLRFQPLGEADPEAWRRLQAANPVPRHTAGDGSLEQPNMELLDTIIAGRTSAELPTHGQQTPATVPATVLSTLSAAVPVTVLVRVPSTEPSAAPPSTLTPPAPSLPSAPTVFRTVPSPSVIVTVT
ncbi:MAG: hypothetical protein U1U88_001633 [Lawsonella clevelandensis]